MTGPAVSMATEYGGHHVVLSFNGTRWETPPVEHLAYYAGLGALAAAEVIDWPVAFAIAIGHLLTQATKRPDLQQLGEALEDA